MIVLPVLIGLAIVNSEFATSLVAAFGLVGVAWQLAQNQAAARATTTYNYGARWDHPDFYAARAAAGRFLDLTGTDADDRWREWIEEKDDPETRIEIAAVLAFWEELASAYNHGLLDDEIFRNDLAYVLHDEWDRADWFIRKARERNANIFSQWKRARNRVKRQIDQQRDAGRRRAEAALIAGVDPLELPEE